CRYHRARWFCIVNGGARVQERPVSGRFPPPQPAGTKSGPGLEKQVDCQSPDFVWRTLFDGSRITNRPEWLMKIDLNTDIGTTPSASIPATAGGAIACNFAVGPLPNCKFTVR